MGNVMMHSQRCIFDADVMPLAHLGAVPVPALHFAAPFTNSIWQGCKHMKKKVSRASISHVFRYYIRSKAERSSMTVRHVKACGPPIVVNNRYTRSQLGTNKNWQSSQKRVGLFRTVIPRILRDHNIHNIYLSFFHIVQQKLFR
jgi:hypothetical protein